MKKNIKKMISILITISLLFSIFSISTCAANIDIIGTEKVIVINEWDEYQRIISKSDEELLAAGLTSAEVAEIRAFNYEDEIRKTAKLSDETLISYGYSNEDIVALRKAAMMKNMPESVIREISTATMISVLTYVSSGSRVESGQTMYYVNMKYSWQWDRVPIFRLIDMVVVAYNSSTSNQFTYYATSNNKVHADLKAMATGDTTEKQTVPWVYSTDKPNSISAKFYICMKDSNGALTHFAYSGNGTFQLTNRSNNARLYVDASYGHAIANVSPSYSVGLSGVDIGIDFGFGIDEQHCTGFFFEDFTISRNYIYHGAVYGKNNTGGNPIS